MAIPRALFVGNITTYNGQEKALSLPVNTGTGGTEFNQNLETPCSLLNESSNKFMNLQVNLAPK